MKRDETTEINVLVFKTSLKYKKDVRLVSPHLSNNTDITRWSVAIDDADRVLRVETGNNISKSSLVDYISSKLHMEGFLCEEMQ
jgi:hypothetical protein